MPLELCPKCKRMHYSTAPCLVRVGVIAHSHPKTTLTAAITKVLLTEAASHDVAPTEHYAHSSKPNILEQMDDVLNGKPPRGRPRIHPDRKAYKAMKAREYRAKAKAEREQR